MAPSSPLPDFGQFGLPDPTPAFTHITTREDAGGQALVEGVVVIPGLPVCRVRVQAQADQLYWEGPGREALLGYVRSALYEEVAVELPWN
jgi:hypothetical protein